MAWQTPKTNWQENNALTPTDFNRIEGNIQHLQDTKETPAGAQAKVDTHANSKQTHGISSGYYIAKTSRSDQLPAWNDIQGKPSSFTPATHGNEAHNPAFALASDLTSHSNDNVKHITDAERNAWNAKETPSGAQSKVDTHASSKQSHGISSGYYIAKTSRSDQLPAWGDIQGKPSLVTSSDLSSALAAKVDKPSSATSGNIAVFDGGAGKIKDSGIDYNRLIGLNTNLLSTGLDGNVTITSNTIIPRNIMAYNNLTINSSATLSAPNREPYIIFVKDTLTLNGIIRHSKGGLGANWEEVGAKGGDGGGVLVIVANRIVGNGTIDVSGEDGSAPTKLPGLGSRSKGGGGENGIFYGEIIGGGTGTDDGDGRPSEAVASENAIRLFMSDWKKFDIFETIGAGGGGGGEGNNDDNSYYTQHGTGGNGIIGRGAWPTYPGQKLTVVGGTGGGGGGALLLITHNAIPSTIKLYARGGNGSTSINLGSGTGGGGGGGLIVTFSKGSSATTSVAAGYTYSTRSGYAGEAGAVYNFII